MAIAQKFGEFGTFGDKIAIGELEAAAQGIERLAEAMTEPSVQKGMKIAAEHLRTRRSAIEEWRNCNTPGMELRDETGKRHRQTRT